MFYCVFLWLTHTGIHESRGLFSVLNRLVIAIIGKYHLNEWMGMDTESQLLKQYVPFQASRTKAEVLPLKVYES